MPPTQAVVPVVAAFWSIWYKSFLPAQIMETFDQQSVEKNLLWVRDQGTEGREIAAYAQFVAA